MEHSTAIPLAPYYRLYDLPWSPTEDVERLFRKVLRIVLAVFVVLAVLVTLLPVPEQTRVKAPDIPDRVVKLLIEKKAPPPPPPPPKVEPEKKPEPVKLEPPKPRPQDAREKAQKSGLLKLQDQLADLRDNTVLDKAAMTKNLTGKVGETTSAERSMITSKVGASSGGINTASLSRGYGGGAGSLTGHNTTQVASAVLAGKPEDGVRRAAGSGKASRSEEEIATVFDRNKGAIYAIYTRALRDKPQLKGKLVLELTISPGGDITKCDVISSELGDQELERKLLARIKLFRFEAKDVGTITVTKPIDFFPA
jgi:TonB family protein